MVDLPGDGAAHLTSLVILGATGSIGRQTLDVAARLGCGVSALAARRGSAALFELAGAHPDATVVVADPTTIDSVPSEIAGRLETGSDAVSAIAASPDVIVVNGIVGADGLAPSLAAVRAGNRLALANKESLVAGGSLLLAAAQMGGGTIVPIDSEHSALWQCLAGEPSGSVARLVLTASGGPFRGRNRSDLVDVSVEDALAHPTWDMGPRITTDSATMMNKALEVIEAHYLFSVDYDQIDVVVHPQSIVHSLVEFVDGSVKAQLGEPDMRVPIQYAITSPERVEAPVAPFDLAGRSLTFEAPDLEAFPCLGLGYEAGRRGGIAPATLNAADEVAVAAFLDGRIRFLDIPDVVAECLAAARDREPTSVADVLAADHEARVRAREAIGRRS